MENNEEVIFSITLSFRKKILNFYGSSQKVKNARRNCSTFKELVKLTIRIDLSISFINVRCYLKMPMPILYGQFLGTISQNPEQLKSVSIDRYNPFHFAYRRWIII